MASVQEDVVAFSGEMAQSLNFNRSVGQIYGLLYVAESPLSLDEIARTLRMSKGNASVNLRALESWGAVRPVGVPGSRKDHYEANRNLKEIAFRRLREGLTKRLDLVEQSLERVSGRLGPKEVELGRRLQEVRRLVQGGRRALAALPKLMSVLSI
jgi:HTH-type transcriptional regulator, glycine betaine synthesis regulator